MTFAQFSFANNYLLNKKAPHSVGCPTSHATDSHKHFKDFDYRLTTSSKWFLFLRFRLSAIITLSGQPMNYSLDDILFVNSRPSCFGFRFV